MHCSSLSNDSNLKACIKRRCEDFDNRDPNRWLRTQRGLPISARTRMPDSQPKFSCNLLSTISSLDMWICRRARTYNESTRSAHSTGSKLCKSCKQARYHVLRIPANCRRCQRCTRLAQSLHVISFALPIELCELDCS